VDSATNKSVDEAKKKPCVVENWGFFLVGTFSNSRKCI